MLKNEKYSEETVVETHRTKKGAKARKQRIKEQGTSKPKKKQKTMFPCDTRKHSLFETNGNLLMHALFKIWYFSLNDLDPSLYHSSKLLLTVKISQHTQNSN